MFKTTNDGPDYKWTFTVRSAGSSTEDCLVTLTATSLGRAVVKVQTLLGLNGKGMDAGSAGALANGALLVIKSVVQL